MHKLMYVQMHTNKKCIHTRTRMYKSSIKMMLREARPTSHPWCMLLQLRSSLLTPCVPHTIYGLASWSSDLHVFFPTSSSPTRSSFHMVYIMLHALLKPPMTLHLACSTQRSFSQSAFHPVVTGRFQEMLHFIFPGRKKYLCC